MTVQATAKRRRKQAVLAGRGKAAIARPSSKNPKLPRGENEDPPANSRRVDRRAFAWRDDHNTMVSRVTTLSAPQSDVIRYLGYYSTSAECEAEKAKQPATVGVTYFCKEVQIYRL
jgi:hypothetical protein